METRPLGLTGLSVSRLGFGAAPLGAEYGPMDELEGVRAVRRAIDLGVTFFDTAPYYGRTLSEERLGRALEGRRHEVVLATKCCRYDVRGFDFSAARVHASIDESLRRLRTDHVDLFQVHDVEFGDEDVIVEETLPALHAVQAAGKARFVGVTGLPVELLARIARRAPIDTVLSYCHHSLLNRELAVHLSPLARERGVGLINGSPLHMGILSPRGPQPWHPAPEAVKAAGRRVVENLQERGLDPAAVALRFAAAHPDVATTLVGVSTVEQLEANVAALEAPADDAALLVELDALIGDALDRNWHEGLPANAPSSGL